MIQIIFQLDTPIQILSLTLAFMNYNYLMVGLRNTLLMSSLKIFSIWQMPMYVILAFLKKYKTSELRNRLLLLVNEDL